MVSEMIRKNRPWKSSTGQLLFTSLTFKLTRFRCLLTSIITFYKIHQELLFLEACWQHRDHLWNTVRSRLICKFPLSLDIDSIVFQTWLFLRLLYAVRGSGVIITPDAFKPPAFAAHVMGTTVAKSVSNVVNQHLVVTYRSQLDMLSVGKSRISFPSVNWTASSTYLERNNVKCKFFQRKAL